MPADLIHLVRHGEVHNPDRILYGRLPGYHLSELGHRMADLAAVSLADRPLSALYASPLLRAQESAQTWAARYGLPIVTEERIVEPANWFEGSRFRFPQVLGNPRAWPQLINPLKPSWGEAFLSVEARMLEAIDEAWATTDGGEIVMVSHQLPIVMVARSVKKMRLAHDPRRRRCTLSSITTLAREGDRFVEADYQEPAGELLAASIDLGAV
ncbi:Broad specificity phosphatase-like protein [Leifsonia rubra CMS 76R]|nr:Broad specificity phosphatase-like protein [Leifsonia rubra CMS 76R]